MNRPNLREVGSEGMETAEAITVAPPAAPDTALRERAAPSVLVPDVTAT